MFLYIAVFIFPSILTSLPVLASEKHCTLSCGWFPPGMMLSIQAKEFNLCFIRPENLVSHGLRVLQVPFGKLKVGCRAFLLIGFLLAIQA